MKSIPEVSFSLTHIVGNAQSLLLMFDSFVVLVKVDVDFLQLEMLLEFLKSVSKVYSSSLHMHHHKSYFSRFYKEGGPRVGVG